MNDYDIKSVFEEMEMDLIKRMKRTLWLHRQDEIAKGFDWPQWQALKLKQLEDFKKANTKLLNDTKKVIDRKTHLQIKKQFKEGIAKANKEAYKAGVLDVKDAQLGGSFFGLNDRKLKALIKSVDNDMQDVYMATLRMSNDVYRSAIFKAQVYANSGVSTVQQAIDMATKEFLLRGFNCIEYKNGARHNIADYSDMCIKTANKRANLLAQGEVRQEIGNPLVYISKHNTSCDKCSKWQGRVYIDDVWSGGRGNDGPYPLLSTAISGGLYHPRCRHGSHTYFPGLNSEPEEIQGNEHNHEDEYMQELKRRKKQYERLIVGSLYPANIDEYRQKANDVQEQIENT